ncbi:flagellar hook-basal body complex protein FliE [Crenobacter luteus]|uniref:flagellar hook-basal body complex protein FliE n=1 Tax=Crenobacter luteus TaxID=1452487 RepID=UPI001050F01A|nr:flagellar hook-basal body complex protein FliE [Crenobacter luteus]TCP15598.1 flagellar hook-basal body complex protein FliE [Crenobacter luteus]
MAVNLNATILADQARILNDMAGLARVAGAAPAAGDAHGAESFAQAMMAAVHDVDAQNRAAGDKMAEVDSGASDDLVGAMMMSQEASLSFSMLMQVRNKVVAAVDDLLKMPI